MVCSSHFKAKYVRFLIKYHLFIFIFACIMTTISISFLIYKYDQINYEHLLRGFQAHGTKTSDDYRKLIALIRETQTTHLYPHLINSKINPQTPYPSFNPHINPCKKRFYLSSCPILPYTELTFKFHQNYTTLFDDLNVLQSVCKLEWSLRARYTNCSTNSSCCHLIGPVGLLFNDQLTSLEQCDNLTEIQLHEFKEEWSSCHQSLCLNMKLQTYLTYLDSLLIFKIYLSIENDRNKLLHLYDSIHRYQYKDIFSLKSFDFDHNDEEILLENFFIENSFFIYLTISLYIICLLLFVKNFFFIFIVLFHIFLTFLICFIIYYNFFHFPLTILNVTSLTLYLFIILIDSFLWYSCWFINKHRRDDCTIQRIIENLITQTFYYLIPKNLTAIIALVITYTNQIIAIQYFTVLAFLLISISFFISFTLYPASFIFILRYQSSIPTIEHLSYKFLANTTNCFLDRTLPYLIMRLKAFWLILLTIISCVAFVIIFQWPKLQFDVCRLTFDTLPYHLSSHTYEKSMNNLDIDITYYIGSSWEVPNEPIIPLKDIPKFEHTSEDRLSSAPDRIDTFVYALKTNLSQLIQFCSVIQQEMNQKHYSYKHYQRHMFRNNSLISSIQGESLSINHFPCFGDLSTLISDSISLTNTKFSSYIQSRSNQTTNCSLICSSNITDNQPYECILCLNSNYYFSNRHDDLFLIKNGLRFINDAQNPRYLLQTINYNWVLKTNLNNYIEWEWLMDYLKRNLFKKFYSKLSSRISFWFTSELFSTFSIMEQLEQEKYLLIAIKFILILVFLTLFTGVLGIFVTLTTILNFLTCLATLTLLGFKLTIENISYFVIVLIVCSQYSVLYSISYKLAPTFFFQRENRTMYSLKQLCTTLFHLTFSIVAICSPCLFSSLPYLSKSAMVYIISSLISLIYSTLFLQSLLCYIGPAEHSCCFLPWRLTFTRTLNLHTKKHNDISLRNSSTSGGTRRHHHHRMSTSSHFASSYFSQIFTGSTYFDSEYGGVSESLTISSRRRESSRSHQTSHVVKRNSLLTGELIELYTPRASLAPHSYLNHHRYLRQSSVPRGGLPSTAPARPLYVSPSISPYSQSSIHSQAAGRQHSPSSHIYRPSRSPSPRSFAPVTSTRSLRPCYSAPRLHVPLHRIPTTNKKPGETLIEETAMSDVHPAKKSVMIIQRQHAISSIDEVEQSATSPSSTLSAATRRTMLKETTLESGEPVWLKRSNSS